MKADTISFLCLSQYYTQVKLYKRRSVIIMKLAKPQSATNKKKLPQKSNSRVREKSVRAKRKYYPQNRKKHATLQRGDGPKNKSNKRPFAVCQNTQKGKGKTLLATNSFAWSEDEENDRNAAPKNFHRKTQVSTPVRKSSASQSYRKHNAEDDVMYEVEYNILSSEIVEKAKLRKMMINLEYSIDSSKSKSLKKSLQDFPAQTQLKSMINRDSNNSRYISSLYRKSKLGSEFVFLNDSNFKNYTFSGLETVIVINSFKYSFGPHETNTEILKDGRKNRYGILLLGEDVTFLNFLKVMSDSGKHFTYFEHKFLCGLVEACNAFGKFYRGSESSPLSEVTFHFFVPIYGEELNLHIDSNREYSDKDAAKVDKLLSLYTHVYLDIWANYVYPGTYGLTFPTDNTNLSPHLDRRNLESIGFSDTPQMTVTGNRSSNNHQQVNQFHRELGLKKQEPLQLRVGGCLIEIPIV